MDIEHFRNIVILDAQQSEEKLMSTWYRKVLALFSGEDKTGGFPGSSHSEGFYDSISTLIGNQVR